MERYVESGRLQFAFLHFPLEMHPHARAAAEAAVCAAHQGKFWEMHDALFSTTNALEHSSLIAKASTINLDEERFGECLSGGELTDPLK